MGFIVRLILWVFLLALLINLGPALLQGLISGITEGSKEVATQAGDAAKTWAKEQVEDTLPDWVKETRDDASKVLEVADKVLEANAKHRAYYHHCLANHSARESRGKAELAGCLSLPDDVTRSACYEEGMRRTVMEYGDRSQADDLVMHYKTDCAQYIGLSGGIVKTAGGLFGAATEWIRCYRPEWCTNPELESKTYYQCLQDAVKARGIDAYRCKAYTSSGTDWRICVEVALDKQVAGDMGLRDVQACRDRVTK